MLTEFFPFWTKYWYHVLITIVAYIFLKLFYKILKKDAIFIEKNKHNFDISNIKQLKGNNINYYLSKYKFLK